MEQQVTQVGEQKKRPTFLTVLCILSFIGVAFAVISNLISLFTSKALQTVSTGMMEGMGEISGTEEAESAVAAAAAGLELLAKYGNTLYICTIIAALICLVGVIMMWKLKKAGYFIYIIGEIAPPILTFILLKGFGPLGTFALVVGLIIPIVMIILYGLNVKHMS